MKVGHVGWYCHYEKGKNQFRSQFINQWVIKMTLFSYYYPLFGCFLIWAFSLSACNLFIQGIYTLHNDWLSYLMSTCHLFQGASRSICRPEAVQKKINTFMYQKILNGIKNITAILNALWTQLKFMLLKCLQLIIFWLTLISLFRQKLFKVK